ncbi:thioesterase II family protein [Chroococcidiopsis sp. CCNUC1]|uniref:thioesterase II family protein n=1 Tax=Chroococcidiopsis sp. CCNUC1 TaxID=2653189 RepID=UPI00273A6E1E|nr:alpha/beta fold hydrolase [Chroococcidiopsis sp. CCNUC1]
MKLTPTPATSNMWVACPAPKPQAALRLFCFHYAGGSGLSFRPWLDWLPLNVEGCLVELPGHGMRLSEPPFTRLEPLIAALHQALLPSFTKPFVFFGHSMGALVSFELARRLRREQHPLPLHLFVSGQRSPQIPDPDRPIHALPDSEFLDELRRYNGTPEAVLANTELMQLLLPTLRADFAAIETYDYSDEPPLDFPIGVLGGLQDWKADPPSLESWREQTQAIFDLRLFPGDHFFIYKAQPQVLSYLCQGLNQILNQTSDRQPNL